MTVTRLERELPHRELVEWAEEYRIDPWGTWRDNAHAALIASMIANAFRRSGSRVFNPEDFMMMDPEAAAKRMAERRSASNKNLVELLNAMAK